jgi:TonB family protein
VHAKLHTPYKTYLEKLPPYGPLSDALSVELALAVDEEGRLASVQVVRSSRHTRFDDGVLATLRDAAPYPTPPVDLRASDGRVHLRWSFQTTESGCGIWNAQIIEARRAPEHAGIAP